MYIINPRGLLVALVVKNPPANAGEIRVSGSIPGGGEDPLEKGMATHSSIPACRIPPWTEEIGGLVPGVTKSRTQLCN